MSWNGTSWNFMPERNYASEYDENEQPAQTQWQKTPNPPCTDGNSHSMQSYRHWKEINEPYGGYVTQPDNQRSRQHNVGHMGQPANQTQHPNRNNFSGKFNFAEPAFTQNEVLNEHHERPFTQCPARHSQPYNSEPQEQRQNDYHPTYPFPQEYMRNTMDHQQYQSRLNTSTLPQNMPDVFQRSANNHNPGRSPFSKGLFYNEAYPPTRHASGNFRDEFSESRPFPQDTRGSHTQHVRHGDRQSNSRSQMACDEPYRSKPATHAEKKSPVTWNVAAKQQRHTGPLHASRSAKKSPRLSQLETSLKIITCSTEAIHLWKSTIGESTPLLFELFGTVANIERDETKMCMDLKGRTVRIKCEFFSMDQEPPVLIEGDCVRVIGRMDLGPDVLQCVSLRHATQDEKSFAFKFTDACNRLLHKFTILKNEL